VAFAAQAHAQDQPVPKKATPGAQLEIITGTKIQVTTQAKKGIAVVAPVEGNATTLRLIYVAPASVTSDFLDTFVYKDDNAKEQTVTVAVSSTSPPTLANGEMYEKSFKALFVLFIIATVLESGLAVLFNWRPFLEKFDSRGVKTLVSVLVAYVFVASFDLDIITALMNVYTDKNYPISFPGEFITALIIAGGSSAVNGLFIALGLRSVRTVEQLTPKPPKTEGWVSVALTREKSKGHAVDVLIGDSSKVAVTRVISATANRPPKFLRYFLRDPARVPPSGGYAIPAGSDCVVELTARDSQGNPVKDADGSPVSAKWGPHPIAAGAIVDIEITL
jgi:hypothetical protein